MIDMLDARCPRITLCSPEASRLDDVRQLLDAANYDTSYCPLSMDGLESHGLDELDLVVVEGPARAEKDVLDFCQRFRERLSERFVPLVFITDDAGPVLRAFLSRVGTDGHVVRPVDPVVLLSQVQALLRVKFLQDRVVQQADEIRQAHAKLRIAYQQIDNELELASRIQRSLLPRSLPSRPPIRFAAKFAVSGQVSGDLYDLFEIDDDVTAFHVSDAMGHGVPAGLITIFAKRSIQPVEAWGGRSRILTPSEVLSRLNEDLVRQDLSENPFLTMCYFVLRRSTLSLDYARGGHPYPLLVRADDELVELKSEGSLLGVFETDFPTAHVQLRPGDKLLIYTDGIDGGRFRDERPGVASLKACVHEHRHRCIEEMVQRICEDLFPDQRHDDDLTVLGVEVEK